MSDLNEVIIEGRLTKPADLTYFADQTPYCQFSIGNNESYKDQNGEYQSIGSFFDCSLKGAYGEAMHKHLTKGRQVTVVGRLKQSRWEKDGQKFSKVIIKVEKIHLGPQPQNNGQQQPQQSYQQPQQQNYQQPQQPAEDNYIPFEVNGEDIPF